MPFDKAMTKRKERGFPKKKKIEGLGWVLDQLGDICYLCRMWVVMLSRFVMLCTTLQPICDGYGFFFSFFLFEIGKFKGNGSA